MTQVQIKRVYDPPAADDGYRILVDRLWPRGVSRERADLDEWMKDVAPSAPLRQWWAHDRDRLEEFSRRYRSELDHNTAITSLRERLHDHASVTLVYAAHDRDVNHAAVLRDYLLHDGDENG